MPGHGLFYKFHNNLTFTDWQNVAKQSYRFASQLGDKVVIAGQSTGGLLAYGLSLEHPRDLAGLILIEPSFEVQRHPSISTCLGRNLVSEAQDFGFLVQVFAPDSNLNDLLPIEKGADFGIGQNQLMQFLSNKLNLTDYFSKFHNLGKLVSLYKLWLEYWASQLNHLATLERLVSLTAPSEIEFIDAVWGTQSARARFTVSALGYDFGKNSGCVQSFESKAVKILRFWRWLS